ncbi:hypothetical protein [Streptomyces longisporoflavus]|uniref:Uncharacterized protein n=1 Tax=Streptomyces longisporoflavus TaxID=28044 RepID=A0ABW7QH15_9ACTN
MPTPTPRALADTWQVMYRSIDALGEPHAVTATVVAPKGGSLPLTWKTYDTPSHPPWVADHLWPIQAANAEAKRHLADRFAGRPATPHC